MTTPMDANLAALIAPHTGTIRQESRTKRGYSSDYTGIITADDGRTFVKAVRDGSRNAASLEREAAINPHVTPIAPALLWQAHGNGWHALGFEYAEGRHADFRPGSADLPAVLRAVDAIGRTPLPEAARDWPETRYDRYADDATAGLFRGDALLHTDINPDNILIRHDGGTAVVDWAWPARGPAWMDPACLVVQLISAGHPAADAERWAARCASWKQAQPGAVDAFAAAVVRMYWRFEEMDPEPWRKAMTAAAQAWAEHRNVTVTRTGCVPQEECGPGLGEPPPCDPTVR